MGGNLEMMIVLKPAAGAKFSLPNTSLTHNASHLCCYCLDKEAPTALTQAQLQACLAR